MCVFWYYHVSQLCINAASGAKIHTLDDDAPGAAVKSFVGYIVKGKPQYAGYVSTALRCCVVTVPHPICNVLQLAPKVRR